MPVINWLQIIFRTCNGAVHTEDDKCFKKSFSLSLGVNDPTKYLCNPIAIHCYVLSGEAVVFK